MSSFYEKLAGFSKGDKDFALCTVVRVKGSAPRKTGAKMVVFSDGIIDGTIGGGDVEKNVIENALSAIRTGKPELFRHDLLHQHSMCCGGTMEIFIEPVMKRNLLYIFGAGHTGIALARLAAGLDFDIVIIDDRREYIDACEIPGVNKMNLSYKVALPVIPFNDRTYICIMTYSHQADREILAYCVKKPHAYLGMIGSRRKTELTRKIFMEAGIPAGEIGDVDMPMGIDIGAEGPEEIAISVIGKIIEVKNKIIPV